jgi:Arc/MetJ-type ribon-helix-helix transcriptional regulator
MTGGPTDQNRRITLRLNQQQFELIDRSVAEGEAPGRAELIRRALAEFVQSHAAPSPAEE